MIYYETSNLQMQKKKNKAVNPFNNLFEWKMGSA